MQPDTGIKYTPDNAAGEKENDLGVMNEKAAIAVKLAPL